MKPEHAISRAEVLLYDDPNVRWERPELLRYVADAQQLIGFNVPDAVSKTETVILSTGTRQTIPTHANRLIRVVRNMGPDGSRPGTVVTITDREALDSVRPGWHEDSGSEIQHFIYDPMADSRTYYVYPGPAQAIHAEIVIARKTPLSVNEGEEMMIGDQWINSVVDWVLARAFQKDADYGGNLARAASHAELFFQSIGVDFRARALVDPNAVLRSMTHGPVQ